LLYYFLKIKPLSDGIASVDPAAMEVEPPEVEDPVNPQDL
jgi:hypothetical protein